MRILLAIDGSPCSNFAVEEVCRRPWPAGSEVRLITVLLSPEPSLLGTASHHPTAYDDFFKQQSGDALRFLDKAADSIRQSAPSLIVTRVLLEGRPKDIVLDEAERWGADLIVLGSHGRGIIKRLFLGSVSLAVVLNAPCSVEIVRCPSVLQSMESINVD